MSVQLSISRKITGRYTIQILSQKSKKKSASQQTYPKTQIRTKICFYGLQTHNNRGKGCFSCCLVFFGSCSRRNRVTGVKDKRLTG